MQIKPEPNRLSPLHTQHQMLNARFSPREGWLIPDAYTTPEGETAALQRNVGLADISAQGKVIVKGLEADGIISAHFGKTPAKFGEVLEIESNHLLVARLTMDEFLILTPPGIEQEIVSSLEAEISSQNTFVSVIDQTSGLVGLSISGPESSRVMMKLCALDFNPIAFPNLHVAQSSFSKVRATIIRHDQGGLPTFELFADRSYADYLWDAILDAGMEFGIQLVGWEALRGQND